MNREESAALQRAIDALSIEDVCVRSLHASIENGFEPAYDADLDSLEIALKHVVKRFELFELESAEQAGTQRYRVFVEFGIRWSRPVREVPDAAAATDATAIDEVPEDDPNVVAVIEAEMMAEYAMGTNPGHEALDVFARHNASFHVWPYWRELVSSQCLRMSLPKVVLPARQFASNSAEPAPR
jgi:deoxyribodipyrimidine photolyase